MMGIPVQVAVRVRPLLPTDRLHEVVCVDAFPYANQIVVGSQKIFTVDYALPMSCSQSQLFSTAVYPLVNCVLEGYDISIITYGQSGSGKTYTILGPGLHCALSETEYGMIPRVTREIFTRLAQIPGRRFKVTVSFIEIYEEGVRDLLNTSQFKRQLAIVDEQDDTVVIGAEEFECQSISEVFNCLHVGMTNRQVGWVAAQQQQQQTCHSHSIFTLTLEQQWIVDNVVHHRISKAQFTDLGGSEKTVLVETGSHFIAEAINLDRGLVALGNVVSTLTEPQWQHVQIPYMQSVLTRMLKKSFGGKATTLVIGCVSPASLDFDETLNTLRFLTRMRAINNTPVINGRTESRDPLVTEITSEEQYTDVLDSEERSTNADTFGLEFAASQWLKLVANAEDLFSKLVTSKYLSRDEKDQIERWLCLKQECEECVGSDDAASYRGFEGRTLERIDEITESEEKSETSIEGSASKTLGNSKTVDDKSHCGSETESDQESQHPDFLEKLDDLIQKFKCRTDGTVRNKRDSYVTEEQEDEKNDDSESFLVEEQGDETPADYRPSSGGATFARRKSLGGRRKSIHPGADLPDLTLALNRAGLGPPLKEESVMEASCQVDGNIGIEVNGSAGDLEDCASALKDAAEAPLIIPRSPGPYKELQMLSAGTEARQSQIRQVLIDLEGAHKRIEELQYTIQIKEQFIKDMIKNSQTRASAKQRFQRKSSKLEEEYYKTRTHLAQAENALLLTEKDSTLNEEKLKHKKEIEKYKNLALHYEKRLKDIEMIKQIAGDSAKKVLELENSLQTSRKQMEKLKKQLKKEEKHKQCLEQELLEDQRKIKELEQKYNLQTSKLNDAGETPEEERLRWIQEEEERIVSMRESSQRLQEQLLQQQTMLEKREAFLKEKLCLEKCKTKSIREVSARISHLEQVLKEKSTDLEKAEDLDEKEALRHEIWSLRKTKDCLLEERCGLDEKFQKDKKLSTVEERKLLECEEAIEAIDAAIEYKNELICGRKGQGLDSSHVQREKGEKLLVERLMKLSAMEMKTLLYKYFQKVIDLRENGRKLEVQLAELELQNEAQSWKIQALINALEQAHFQAERRIVVLQKEHQEKLHIMLRHFAEESSGSSGAEAASRHLHCHGKYKRENRILRKRLQELEALLKTDARVRRRSRSVSPVTIPQQNLKQLQGSGSTPTTKVTREKNKLIIQQHKSKKPWRS
ncbi:kinesin-like protein costa [Periplaneta americana]|uniref:kinesin-like protein costa n=1 Tax=Periplaneta americana TaxID=6978 RepID=UPI0037E7AB36